MATNNTLYCIPHFQIFDGCPERAYPTRVHCAVLLAFNFFAGVVLFATLLRRARTIKPVEWNNFYVILSLLAAGNFFTSISLSFIINTDFAKIPPAAITALTTIGANFGMIACMYTIITWMEVLDTRTFLVYYGLKEYRNVFWISSAVHFVFTVGPAVVAGIRLDLYPILWRIYWGWWVLELIVCLILLAIYGIRTLKLLKPEQKRIFKFSTLTLCNIGIGYMIGNIIQLVLVETIDRTLWVWHTYWVLLGGQNGFLTLIYATWSWAATNQRKVEEKKRSQASAAASGTTSHALS